MSNKVINEMFINRLIGISRSAVNINTIGKLATETHLLDTPYLDSVKKNVGMLKISLIHASTRSYRIPEERHQGYRCCNHRNRFCCR